MDDRSNKDLVVACLAGDKNAYGLLVKRHYKLVFLTCLGFLGNVYDAEDIAQETMLKGYMKLKTLKDASQFGPWLTRIAKNLCINLIRKTKNAKRFAEQTLANIDRKTDEAGEYDHLQEAIEKLPKETRAPLVMYYFDGRSIETVADRLQMSSSTVYLRLRTDITELHTLLAKKGDEK